MPNAFTPNDDHRNDQFYAVTNGVKTFYLAVFDRWGELLFSTTDPATGWDGTYRGQPCKQDMYVWKVRAAGFNHQQKDLSGTVLLTK